MGLSVSHNCFDGRYSSFNQLRNALAVAAGYKLTTPPPGLSEEVRRFFCELPVMGETTADQLAGIWPEMPEDPILVILHHSDCEGNIYPAQAGMLAGRIQQLAPSIPKQEVREAAERFAKGLWDAFAKQELVEFN